MSSKTLPSMPVSTDRSSRRLGGAAQRPPAPAGGRVSSSTGLMGWRRPWRAEDLHSVASSDREQALHVRRTVERRRQHTRGRLFTDFVQEAFELEGLEADQCLRSIGLGDERVRYALGPEGEGAGGER